MPTPLPIGPDQASTLADFTSPGLLVPQLCGRDIASVIQELSQALAHEARVPDGAAFQQAVLNREALTSTQMESGMAFPHARLPGLNTLSFALGRSAKPLVWSSGGAASVRLVFLLAVPEDDSTRHLRLISGLSRLSQNRRLMTQLQSAQDAAELFATLQQVPLAQATGNPNTRNRL